jgi:predicted ATPase
MRQCPTRVDDAPVLIAHTITLVECQKRQREHFHRCPTCVHQNARELVTVPAAIGEPLAVKAKAS